MILCFDKIAFTDNDKGSLSEGVDSNLEWEAEFGAATDEIPQPKLGNPNPPPLQSIQQTPTSSCCHVNTGSKKGRRGFWLVWGRDREGGISSSACPCGTRSYIQTWRCLQFCAIVRIFFCSVKSLSHIIFAIFACLNICF